METKYVLDKIEGKNWELRFVFTAVGHPTQKTFSVLFFVEDKRITGFYFSDNWSKANTYFRRMSEMLEGFERIRWKIEEEVKDE